MNCSDLAIGTPVGEYFEDLHYTKIGNGPPVIALHGLGATSFSWRHIRSDLQAHNTLYLFDLRGHGKSRWCGSRELFSIEEQAETIVRFIRDRDLNGAFLIGHSLGGGIALAAASQLIGDQHHSPGGLVLIDSVGFGQKRLPIFFRILRTPHLARAIVSIVPHTWLVTAIMRRAFFDSRKVSHDAVVAYAANLDRPHGIDELITTAQELIPNNTSELMARIQEIEAPVLLIWGTRDPFVPPGIGIALNVLLNNAKWTPIDSCGHLPQEEKPEITTREINKFFRKIAREMNP